MTEIRQPTIAKEVFASRGKFNSILEERLQDGNAASHHIISIDVHEEGFDLTGELNSIGKESFWKEIDKGLKKFDTNEIKLLPRNFLPTNKIAGMEIKKTQPSKQHSNPANFVKSVVKQTENNKRKLPTPPPRADNRSHQRSSRSRSKTRHGKWHDESSRSNSPRRKYRKSPHKCHHHSWHHHHHGHHGHSSLKHYR